MDPMDYDGLDGLRFPLDLSTDMQSVPKRLPPGPVRIVWILNKR
jgi:hypothetical protein